MAGSVVRFLRPVLPAGDFCVSYCRPHWGALACGARPTPGRQLRLGRSLWSYTPLGKAGLLGKPRGTQRGQGVEPGSDLRSVLHHLAIM